MTNITTSAFTLKGSMMTLTVMHLNDPRPEAINKQLSKTITETPNLFRNMPIVIDLQKVEQHPEPIDFAEISAQLREYGLIPVGVSNGSEAQHQSARMSALGTLSTSNKNTAASRKPAAAKPKKTEQIDRPMIINQPVRSGQQIYAKNGDLIILAAVSNGAEVIADGNIHIYGSLRGRAIAGAKGDTNTRVFCQSLQAELVSIAGNYKLHEQLADLETSGPVVAWLDQGQLEIHSL